MTLSSHLAHHPLRPPTRALRRVAADHPRVFHETEPRHIQEVIDDRVYAVQRLGAVCVGLVLLVFGLLGAAGGVGFLATHGQRHLGMSTNGLLSLLSLVVAVVLLGAAFRGPRTASTVMIVLGVLFLASALLNMAVLRTAWNVLAFRMSNVVFSVVVGLVLLLLGAYGRITGNLPASSPYAHPHPVDEEPSDLPSTPAEVAAEAAMREAEFAVVQHYATEDQQRRVRLMSGIRTREGRRRAWMAFESAQATDARG